MSWSNAGDIHQALEKAALPICGVAFRVPDVHGTQYGASFIRCGELLIRVDWRQKPTKEQKKVAASIVGGGCDPVCESPEVIDSVADSYPADQPPPVPRRITDVVACYFVPRVWVGGSPKISHDQADLTCVFDEVYRELLGSGIKVRILRLGIFVFDFSGSNFRTTSQTEFSQLDAIADLNLRRLAALNTYFLCLASVFAARSRMTLEKCLIRPADLLVVHGFDAPDNIFHSPHFIAHDVPAYHELTASFFRHVAGGELLHYNAVLNWQRQDFTRVFIDLDTIKESFRRFGEILQHPEDHALLLASLIAKSCKAHEEFDYGLALISSWSVTEKLLVVLWERFIASGQGEQVTHQEQEVPLVDGNRKKRLLDHRSYTSSVIAEILQFQGILPFDLYKSSNEVRKARNDWIHSLRSVSRTQGEQAIQLALAMLKLVEGIDLPVHPITQVMISTQT